MLNRIAFLILFLNASLAHADEPVAIYSESMLLGLFKEHRHLEQVVSDECQLVEDIIARASRINLPTYEFLYGEMLTQGVCVAINAELGVYYVENAAKQGLPIALETLGRYYSDGDFVQQDKERAIPYLREAAAMGDIDARIHLAELLIGNYGSPMDYEDTYRWLYTSVTSDQAVHQQIKNLTLALEDRMPQNIIAQAKEKGRYW